jgi:type II secretory pathway pseudopilin PulG
MVETTNLEQDVNETSLLHFDAHGLVNNPDSNALLQKGAKMNRSESRDGLTLLELVVIIAIIGILIGMLLPAVRRVREATPRVQCLNNLRQLALATLNYESAHMRFPHAVMGAKLGGDAGSTSGMVGLLPFLEENLVYETISEPQTIDGRSYPVWPNPLDRKYPPWKTSPAFFRCPTVEEGSSGFGPTHYAMNIGDRARNITSPKFLRGPFAGEQSVSFKDFADGTANTIMFGEVANTNRDADCPFAINQPVSILDDPAEVLALAEGGVLPSYRNGVSLSDLGRGAVWSDGLAGIALFNTILPPNSPSAAANGQRGADGVFSASGPHGVVNFAMLDGSVRSIDPRIDAGNSSAATPTEEEIESKVASPYGVWGALGTIAGGEPKEEF